MKHPFIPSLSNKLSCAACHRALMEHGPIGHCEACDCICPDSSQKGSNLLEVFGKLDDPRAMLLCPKCTQKEIDANSSVLSQTQKVIQEAKEIDQSIRYNGDFFNAKTIAINDIKIAIDSDASLTADEKVAKLHQTMAERLEHLQQVVFKARREEAEANVEILVIKESLREFGNRIREEIRERIKAADVNYQPARIVKPPKITAPKKSAMDRVVEAYAMFHNVTQDVAREAIMKGKTN